MISCVQFINRMGSMVIFFLAIYLRERLHFSIEEVGILMSAFGIGSLAGVYIGGRLIDYIGYYPVMLISLIGGGCMFFIVAELESFTALCIGLPIMTLLAEGFRPAGHVAIIEHSNADNYTRTTALYRLAINLGFSIGPAIGGVLAAIDYVWVFRADGFSSILAGVSLLFILRPKKIFITDQKQASIKSPWRDKNFLLLILTVAFYAIAFFQLFSVMSLYYRQQEGFSESEIGILLAINGLFVAVFEMFLIFKIEKKGSPFRWILIGCILLLSVYLLLYVLHGFWNFVLLILLISISEMLAMPFMNTLMNQLAAGSSKGQYAGLYVMAWSVAPILSPIIATQLTLTGGYPLVWLGFAVFCMLSAVSIYLLRKQMR